MMVDRKWVDLWLLRFENPLEDAETLILDDDNYITELGKKPENYDSSQGQYTGLIKLRSDKTKDFIAFYNDLDRDATYDGKDFDNMYMTSFIQLLINKGWKVKACMVDSGWLEVDSIEDLDTYENMQSNGDLERFYKLGEQ
jgi:choline kinase